MLNIIVNYWAVAGGTVFLFVMGMIWYGPLFGKTWGRIMGAEHISKEEMAKMQKEMMPMYGIQIVLSAITSCVLYHFVALVPQISGIEIAFWVWLGFAMPMAAGAMWDTKKGDKMTKFLIIAGYQLITLLVLGWAFMMW